MCTASEFFGIILCMLAVHNYEKQEQETDAHEASSEQIQGINAHHVV